MNDLCPKCHGLIVPPNTPHGYAGPVCACNTLLNKAMPVGWQCPVCGAVRAPHMVSCEHGVSK